MHTDWLKEDTWQGPSNHSALFQSSKVTSLKFVYGICSGCSVTRLGDLLDMGQLLKPLATINLPKYPAFLGNFCKSAIIFNFSSEIILGQLL